MKKLFSLVVVVLIATMLASAVFAAELPGSGWWSGEQIQNVGTETAEITVIAYGGGTTDPIATHSVDAGGSYTFVPGDFAEMEDGFKGAAVASANQPIKAVVNVTNRQSGSLGVSGGKAAAQYQGIDASMVDTTLYVPIAKGDSFSKTTTYFVQNAGAAATTFEAVFTMRNGSTHTYTSPSVEPNEMVSFSIFDTPTYTTSGVPNDAKVGSVVITSAGEPLAGIVMEHYTTEAIATIAQSTRAFTSADFDDKAYAPIIKNNRFGRSTGIQVQNVGAAAIDITVTYKGSAGVCVGQTFTDTATNVAAGTAKVFNQLAGQSNLPENCTAAATITATGDFVALVSESFISSAIPASGQSSVTSFAIPDSSATTIVSAPLFKDDRFGKRTGMQVQNVGATDATIVATFACTGGATFTAVTNSITVVSGGGYLFYTPNDDAIFTAANPFPSNNVNCGVTITSNQPIVAIANESVIPGGSLQQDNNNYEAFNLVP